MQADAFQTTACWWLSLSALVGVGLNAAWGLWWADPAAAIAMTDFMLKEGREAWRGEHDGFPPRSRANVGGPVCSPEPYLAAGVATSAGR